MKAAGVILALALVGCAPSGGPVRSDDPWTNLEAIALFDRAEQYYARQQYPQAINDYRKFLDLYMEYHRGDDASFRIAQSLEAMGERMEATNVYRAVAFIYNKSSIAPAAFLRAGELHELEGFLLDAEFDYGKAARYRETEPGKIAAGRLKALRDRIAQADAERMAASEEERRQKKELRDKTPRRAWPPTGRSLVEVIRGH